MLWEEKIDKEKPPSTTVLNVFRSTHARANITNGVFYLSINKDILWESFGYILLTGLSLRMITRMQCFEFVARNSMHRTLIESVRADGFKLFYRGVLPSIISQFILYSWYSKAKLWHR